MNIKTEWLVSLIERSPLLSSANYGKGQLLYHLGLSRHHSGTTHTGFGFDIEQSVDYIRGCGRDYLAYSGIGGDEIRGLNMLEIGPGDNLGVALYFIGLGAARVVCLEAFDVPVDEARNARIYGRLLDTFPPEARARAERAVRFVGPCRVEFDPDLIECLCPCRVEDATRHVRGETFDVVYSRAVMEHVSDVEASWRAMVRVLKPAGMMWHKVDFRNHGYFGQFHPLYFLTYGDRYWNLISSPDPTLNRSRLGTYRRLADETFGWSQVFITHVLQGEEILPHVERLEPAHHYTENDVRLVSEIRPHLASPFRTLPEEELLVSGIFQVCRDPIGAGKRVATEGVPTEALS